MRALFIELPSFERHRRDYLDDEAFSALQQWLMQCPDAGDLIQGCGGLRKLRYADCRRQKGSVAEYALSITGGLAARSAGCLRCTAKMNRTI